MLKIASTLILSLCSIIIYLAIIVVIPSVADTLNSLGSSFGAELPWISERVLASYRYFWIIGAALTMLSLLLLLISLTRGLNTVDTSAASAMANAHDANLPEQNTDARYAAFKVALVNILIAFGILILCFIAMYAPIFTLGEVV